MSPKRIPLRLFIIALVIFYAGCQEDFPPLEVSIENGLEQVIPKGKETVIPYSFSGGDGSASAYVLEATGAKCVVDDANGVLRITLTEDSGTVCVMFTSAGKKERLDLSLSAIRLLLTSPQPIIPDKGGEIVLSVDTNLPFDRIKLSLPDWAKETGRGNGTISVTFDSNQTFWDRSCDVTVSSPENVVLPVSISLTQSWINERENGYLYFPDKKLAEALREPADINKDNRISAEEAEAVTNLDLSWKKLTDLTGIDNFRNLEKLNLNNNDIQDAGMLKNLKELYWIDLRYNSRLTYVDISGCQTVFDTAYLCGNYDTNVSLPSGGLVIINKGEAGLNVSLSGSNVVSNKEFPSVIELRRHTEGRGIRVNIVFEKLPYRMFQDNSFKRLYEGVIEHFLSIEPVASFKDCFDFFIYSDPTEEQSFRLELEQRMRNEGDEAFHEWFYYLRPYVLHLHGYPSSTSYGGDREAIIATTEDGKVFKCERNVIGHELQGHCFGGLADEYENRSDLRPVYGPNVDNTDDPETIKWSRFLKLDQYKKTVGIFEGANYRSEGWYRPSSNSIMRSLIGGPESNSFNAPSRYAIFKKLLSLSQIRPDLLPVEAHEEEIFQAFLEYDKINL